MAHACQPGGTTRRNPLLPCVNGGQVTGWEIAAIFVAALAAGAINAVVGSGSLITFPTLLAFGIPPVVANVSNNVGLVPGNVSGVLRLSQGIVRAARPAAAARHRVARRIGGRRLRAACAAARRVQGCRSRADHRGVRPGGGPAQAVGLGARRGKERAERGGPILFDGDLPDRRLRRLLRGRAGCPGGRAARCLPDREPAADQRGQERARHDRERQPRRRSSSSSPTSTGWWCC